MKNALAYLIIMILIVVLILQALILIRPFGKFHESASNAERTKELANTLLNKELYQQAISEYLKYLEKEDDIDPAKRTNILYMIANTYYEKIKDYENALAYYYRAKFYEPKGELLKQINRKIVSCLERLERSLDAKNELESAALFTGEDKKKAEDESPVVAKIDDKIITMKDLESEIENLPLSLQAEYDSPEKKLEILNQIVSAELFYEAAQRLGLDKDKEIIAKTFEIKKRLMAQKYLLEQLKDKLKLEPEDLNLYYEANKERYKTPKKAIVRMMAFSQKEKAESAKKRLDGGEEFSAVAKELSEDVNTAGNGGLLGEVPYGSPIPGFGSSRKFSEIIFSIPPNKTGNVEKIEDKYFIFKVEKYIPEKQKSLAEVIDKVKEDALREKEFAESVKLMERLSKTHDVRIFEDVVLGLASK